MLTIAWDIDDCLNELMLCWFKQRWLKKNPKCCLKFADLKENPPHQLLEATKEAYLKSLDEFRLSRDYRNMQPNPEVKEWFLHHGKFFRHIAISAVPLSAADVSAQWLLKHFGTWIRTFHFVPSVRKGLLMPSYDKNKKDFLRWFAKVDIFVDDNDDNIRDSQELGIKGIIFPQPWNSSTLTINEALGELTKIYKSSK